VLIDREKILVGAPIGYKAGDKKDRPT
jgi:hypothetical protein